MSNIDMWSTTDDMWSTTDDGHDDDGSSDAGESRDEDAEASSESN